MINFNALAQSNIINTLNLADAPKEIQREAIDEAMEIIFDSVTDRMKAELSGEALAQYEQVFRDQGSEEERTAFIKKYVPHFDEIVREETLRYKYLMEIMNSSPEK